jgi:amino acid transporter
MVVVPKSDQLNPSLNVAQQFFHYTFGKVANGKVDPQRILSAFIAISTFGNIVVMTFVAARVKQEIAKEGVLPAYKFFGSSQNVSFGRLLEYAHRKKDSLLVRNMWWLLKMRWMDPHEHTQETPVGALFLHWFFTVVMILVTIHLAPLDAYNLLVGLYSYAVVAVFGLLVAVGVLKLRFSRREKWRKKSAANPFLSITAASFFVVGCAYPIVASWVPPMGQYSKLKPVVPWFTVPTVSWSMLAFGVIWYLGFLGFAAQRRRKEKVEFKVDRVADFVPDPSPDGPLVQVHETVYLAWVAKEVSSPDQARASISSRESF